MIDIGAAVIVLVIFGVIILPIIFYNLIKRNKKMKLAKYFVRLAEKERLVISQKELWKNCYIIGIDNHSKKLLYIHSQKDKSEEAIIDLSDVEKCRIESYNKTLKNQSGKNNLSDRLELIFSFLTPKKPEKVLEFYDSTEFMPSSDDYSHTENWLNIINSNLKTSQK